MCWRLSVLLFGGREGHWNTKNRFIKDKNSLLPGGFPQSELCCVAWLNHFSREARGSPHLFEGKGREMNWTQHLRERESSLCVCWGSACQHLWAWLVQPSEQELLLCHPSLATCWKGRWVKELFYKSLLSPPWRKSCCRLQPWNAFLSETCL